MLHRGALAKTDVSEEPSASFIRVTRIGVLGTTLAVTSNRSKLQRRRLLVTASVVPNSPILVTLMKEALGTSETSVITRATKRNITEDTVLLIAPCFADLNCWKFGKNTIYVDHLFIGQINEDRTIIAI
jgi:hypothetical protein